MDDLKASRSDLKKVKNGLLYECLKKKGYKIKSLLVLPVAFLIPLSLILYLGFTQGWGEKWSISCPSNAFNDCMNPFYTCDPNTNAWCPDTALLSKVCNENPGFCKIAILKPGEKYGHEQGAIEKNFFSITIFCVFIAYLLNHLIYNSAEQRKIRREEYENGAKTKQRT